MTNPTITRAAAAIAIAAALALGIAVLVQSARGQQDDATPAASVPYPTADPNATPTFTVQQLSDASEAARATSVVQVRDAASKVIDAGSSVAAVPRHELRVDVAGPGGADETFAVATGVVTGRVTGQTIARPTDPAAGPTELRLISTVATASGVVAVAQDVRAGLTPSGELYLGYFGLAGVPLEVGRDYSMLVGAEATPSARAVLPGYAFEIQSDGTLNALCPFEGSETLDGSPAPSLLDAFESRRAQ